MFINRQATEEGVFRYRQATEEGVFRYRQATEEGVFRYRQATEEAAFRYRQTTECYGCERAHFSHPSKMRVNFFVIYMMVIIKANMTVILPSANVLNAFRTMWSFSGCSCYWCCH